MFEGGEGVFVGYSIQCDNLLPLISHKAAVMTLQVLPVGDDVFGSSRLLDAFLAQHGTNTTDFKGRGMCPLASALLCHRLPDTVMYSSLY